MNNQLIDFLSLLSNTKSSDLALQEAQSYFHNIGLDKTLYFFCNNKGGDENLNNVERVCNLPSDWWDWYDDNDYGKIDPFFEYCCNSYTPTITGADSLPDWLFVTEKQQKLIAETEEIDFKSGLALPMRLKSENESFGGWNIGTNLPSDKFIHLIGDKMANIAAVATYTHLHIDRLKRSPTPTQKLTVREKECLLWLSKGKMTQGIAEKLGIKPVTVDMHIKNARTKLNATTREQALAIAIYQGQISP